MVRFARLGMLISVIFFVAIDIITNVNFIGFIPESVRNVLPIKDVGISMLFIILYCLYEGLSVLKNMVKCKLPIPKRLQTFLEKLFQEFTTELNEEKGDK